MLSGKIIADVQLWKIDSLKIEYVKNGNLSDVQTSDVSTLVFSDGTSRKFNNAIAEPVAGPVTIREQENINTTFTPENFRRLHIYFGGGRNIGSARTLYTSAFNNTTYQGFQWIGDSVWVIQGSPRIWLSEGVYFGADYDINYKLRAGAHIHPYRAFFEGYKGEYKTNCHSLAQEIIGNRYYLAASYSLYKGKRPFRMDVSAGASLIINSHKVFTRFRVFDTLDPGIFPGNEGAVPVYEESTTTNFRKIGAEVFTLADIYVAKWFSVFIKPSLTFDQGLQVKEKVFASNNPAFLPSQKINFTGAGLSGGISFHFVKRKKGKLIPLTPSDPSYNAGVAVKKDTIVSVKEGEPYIENEGDSILPRNKNNRSFMVEVVTAKGKYQSTRFVAKDSSISLFSNGKNREFPVEKIFSINLTDQGKSAGTVIAGIGLGVIAGGLLGIAAGVSIVDPHDDWGLTALGMGLLGMIAGGVTGGMAVAPPVIKVPINGSQAEYKRILQNLKTY